MTGLFGITIPEEYGIERGYRDARITRIYEIASEIPRAISAKVLLRRYGGAAVDPGPIFRAGSLARSCGNPGGRVSEGLRPTPKGKEWHVKLPGRRASCGCGTSADACCGWRLVSMLWALAGFVPGPIDSRIQFSGGVHVPRAVQVFAWRVIETSCNYQSYELQQRSFWAYDVKTRQTDAGVAYSIHILSEVPWKKTIPPAFIEMTVVDDGGVRLTALKSSIVVCTPPMT